MFDLFWDYLLKSKNIFLFAAMDGVFFKGIPQKFTATLADGAGWMGDFITTLVDYKNHKDDYDNAYDLAMDYIGATKVNGYYNIDDYIQDIDGWNLGYQILSTESDSPANIIKQYYESSTLNRYNYFFETRHGNDKEYLTESLSHAYRDSPTSPVGFFRLALLKVYDAKEMDTNIPVKKELIKAYIDIFMSKLE